MTLEILAVRQHNRSPLTISARGIFLKNLRIRLPILLAALFLAHLGSLSAQFIIVAQDEDTISELRPGSTMTFSSGAVGEPVSRLITVTFDGPETSSALIAAPRLAGSGGSRTFEFVSHAELPVRIKKGESVDFTITFTPNGLGPFSNVFTLKLNQTDTIIFQRGPVTREIERTREIDVPINLSGLVANYQVTFQAEGEGNEMLVEDGSTVRFPDAELGQTSTAAVLVRNNGTGLGSLKEITLSGTGEFAIAGLRLVPAEIAAGDAVSFTLSFTPLELGTSAASVHFAFGLGTLNLTLTGEGVTADFIHETIIESTISVVMEGETISFPPAMLGEETSIAMRVTNGGNIDGSLSSVSVTGVGFTVGDLPILPATLEPGQSAIFTLTFTPAEPAVSLGQLRVNNATFLLEGEGLGPMILYSLISDGVSSEVGTQDTLIFPSTRIGESSSLVLEISNSGNAAETIAGIGASGSAFSVSGIPSLPAQLDPDQRLSFSIDFEPDNCGTLAGSLTVGGDTFVLSGVGEELAALPKVTMGGNGGIVPALQQIAATLSLEDPFPVDLRGTLTIDFTSEVFSDDPAVQFATGGRSVGFRIKAGETSAQFQGGAREVPFQTGTVAGLIKLTPSFQSEIGGFDVTPDPAPELRFSVSRSAPELLNLQITNLNDTGFALQITGLSTARTVDQLEFQFTPVPGGDLQTTRVTATVTSPFSSWYSSVQSNNFGSQFTATVNFNVDGDSAAIGSVAATATNSRGTSPPVSISVQ